MLKKDLQKYAAPVLDEDFCNIVASAVRYALPRNSYMPSLTRCYVQRYWPLLKKMHWCILRDIREHFDDTLRWWKYHPELEDSMDRYDLGEWVKFYNYLITREDTNFSSGYEHLKQPITYNENTETR